MAVTTTLPLFWHLSASSKDERLDSSVKLVSVLEDFQEKFHANQHTPSQTHDRTIAEDDSNESESDNGIDGSEAKKIAKTLDVDNAADVAYALRRLMRGLASPRESSRLGFAVALTELMKRIDTISCDQMFTLLKTTSQASGTISKQEERDILFAQLFGIKSIIQSGLIVSQKPLKSSSGVASTLKSFEMVCEALLALGEEKSWIRESCWWTLCSAIDALSRSDVPWKNEALKKLSGTVIDHHETWTAEKVAVLVKIQKLPGRAKEATTVGSPFKNADILAKANFVILGRILKDSALNEEAGSSSSKSSTTPWKPQLHFVWDIILEALVMRNNLSDFYRIAVDEILFASSSSPERKYWGFLVFQKCLTLSPPSELPMLFTKNFMRTWINHLSKDDRYLHKISRQVALDVKATVEKNPEIGFSIVLQLTGINGSSNFDRVTKTKTVENILASTSKEGIVEYMNHVLGQVNFDEDNAQPSIESRRAWIIDQISSLLKSNNVPKPAEVTELALDWLSLHALFEVRKKSKSLSKAIQSIPQPPFSDSLRRSCSSKLLNCLSDLIVMRTDPKNEANQEKKESPCERLTYVLKTIAMMQNDTKHFVAIRALEENQQKIWSEALATLDSLETTGNLGDAADGIRLLIQGIAMLCLVEGSDDDWEVLQDCSETSKKLVINVDNTKKKEKKKKTTGTSDEDRPPIDFIVDIIIGLLERSSAFSKALANQSFARISPLLARSSIDLILAQLERRDPNAADNDDEDEEGMDFEEDEDLSVDKDSSVDGDEEEAIDENEAAALREALDAVISKKKGGEDDEETESVSSASSMDDEQMMAIDEQLTEVFKSEAERRGKGRNTDAQREATHFKNRVLDLVEAYLKNQPTNPLVLRFVIPLLDLACASSSDEKQLSDKTAGILRSRLQKARDVPALDDKEECTALLQNLHERARKAVSSEAVNLTGICSLFVAKSLITSDKKAVASAYETSLRDFITRKASPLTPAFFFDFVRRYPMEASGSLTSILGCLSEAANGYRLTQALSILQAMITSIQKPDPNHLLEKTKKVLQAVSKEIADSCSSEKLSPSQMKDTLKVVQQLCRLSKRTATDSSSFEKAWSPETWHGLAKKLSDSAHYKTSTSLSKTCIAIAKLIESKAEGPKRIHADEDTPTKRKNNADEEARPEKRKKAKKAS